MIEHTIANVESKERLATAEQPHDQDFAESPAFVPPQIGIDPLEPPDDSQMDRTGTLLGPQLSNMVLGDTAPTPVQSEKPD